MRDAERILALEREVFPDEPFSRVQACHLLRAPSTFSAVALAGEETAGFISVWQRRGASTCRIIDLAVGRRFQRLGLGRRLVQWTIRQGRQRGCAGVTLEVDEANSVARDLYSSLGFGMLRRLPHYYQRHRHALRLVRWLGPGRA